VPARDHTTSVARVEYRPVVGAGNYRVGDDGSAWSRWSWRALVDTWQSLTPSPHIKSGHLRVNIKYDGGKTRTRYVHNLILEAFVGPCPPGMECCHHDGDPTNNRLSNLRWGTRLENMDDQARHGVLIKGERVYGAKLTETDVREIRALYACGHDNVELAACYGVTRCNITAIVRRKSWKHVI
jgi:hypothetical protein